MSDTGAVASKRRAAEELSKQDGKRRKPPTKKPGLSRVLGSFIHLTGDAGSYTDISAFKPQPLAQPNSSDTPPEDELSLPLPDLPPPPSERKPARRRPSMRAARPTTPDSPGSPTATSQSAAAAAAAAGETDRRKERARSRSCVPSSGPAPGSSADDTSRIGPASSSSGAGGSTTRDLPARIDFGSLASRASRPSIRPSSPPRHVSGSRPSGVSAASAAARQSMARPSDVFTRKTRKSMGFVAGAMLPTSESAAEGSSSNSSRSSGRGIGLGMPGGVLPTDVAVPLPESETPMIRKNRALREDQSRRSSLGMRGQRASTSLGRGDLIDTTDFYKHISSTIPDPIRARHLLVYCTKRAYDRHVEAGARKSKSSSKDASGRGKSAEVPRTAEGDKIIAEVMDAFLSGLGKGDVETNVFDSNANGSKMSTLPHPKNQANRKVTESSEAAIKRSKDENSAWQSIRSSFTRRQRSTVQEAQRKCALFDTPDGAIMPDMSGAESWLVQAVSFADGVLEAGEGELADMGEFADVEFKVDMLHQSTNAARQYTGQATRFLEGVFTGLSQSLQAHPAGTVVGAGGVGAGGAGAGEGSGPDGVDIVALLAAATGAHSTHSASSAEGSSAGLLSALSSTSAPTAVPAPSRPDPIHALRALAAADVRSGNDEAVRRAGAVAPVTSDFSSMAAAAPHALSHSTGPGSSMGMGMGMGMGMATPRSAPALRRGPPGTGTLGGAHTGAAAEAGQHVPNTTAGVGGTGGLRGRMYGRGTGHQPSE